MWGVRGSTSAALEAGAGWLQQTGTGRIAGGATGPGRGQAVLGAASRTAVRWRAPDIARLGVFLALATSLHIFEAQLPSLPIPGAKIGLANLVSMFALYAWGFREAMLIVVMRQLVGSLVTGTIFAPAFVFGLAGGVLSVAAMGLGLRLAGALGPVAISLVGATAHNIGQLFAAWAMLGQVQVFYYLPYLLWFAVPSGALVGVTAKKLLPFIFLATAGHQAARAVPRPGLEAEDGVAGRAGWRRRWRKAPEAGPAHASAFEAKAAWVTGAVLVAAGVAAAFFMLWQPAAVAHPQAKVTVNGEVYALLPLDEEGTFELNLGKDRMVIEYGGGRVRVAESTCPNRVCVATGWISRPREAVACVPFQVLITITGQSDAAGESGDLGYDALVY